MPKVIDNNIREVMNAIERGDFRDYYLIYNRKSTDEAESQKNSIAYQKRENARYSRKNKIPIASLTIEGFCTDGMVSEKHSGYKTGEAVTVSEDGLVQYRIQRPKFTQLMHYLSKGYFKGVICLCWDRISRNKGDNTVIRKLMQSDVDFHFVLTKYDKSSAGELHMDVDGMFSEHHSRNTSEKVTLTVTGAREDGYCTFKAPFGYMNTGSMKNKPIDPIRGPVVTEMFNLYATGEWSQIALAKWVNEQGVTAVPSRRRRSKAEILADDDDEEDVREKISRPLIENHISRILRNRFYLGELPAEGGTFIKSLSHEPLITAEVFNVVQKLLNKNCISEHYTESLDHPFRGFVRCAQCNRAYTPYEQKGIIYYGAKCRKGCPNTRKSLNEAEIAIELKSVISLVQFTDDELEKFEARTNTEIALLDVKREKELSKIERKKKTIRENISYMTSNRLVLLRAGAYLPEEYNLELMQLHADLKYLQDEEQSSDEAMMELVQDVVKFSELIRNVAIIYDFATTHEKDQIGRILISELYIDDKSVSFQPKEEIKSFFNRNNAVCDPTENRTPISRMKTWRPNR